MIKPFVQTKHYIAVQHVKPNMAAQVEAWGCNTLGEPQSSLKSIDDVNIKPRLVIGLAQGHEVSW